MNSPPERRGRVAYSAYESLWLSQDAMVGLAVRTAWLNGNLISFYSAQPGLPAG